MDQRLGAGPDRSHQVEHALLFRVQTGLRAGRIQQIRRPHVFRGREIPEAESLCDPASATASVRTLRFTSMDALDRGAVRRLLRAAVRLDECVPPPRPQRTAPRPLPPMPPALAAALKQNRAAREFFDSLKPTYQREYLIWTGMAKRPETHQKRLAETVTALAAGRKWAQRTG